MARQNAHARHGGNVPQARIVVFGHRDCKMAIGRQVDSIDSSPVGTYAALVLPALLGSKGEEVGKGEEGRQGKVVGWEVHGQRVSNYLKTIG